MVINPEVQADVIRNLHIPPPNVMVESYAEASAVSEVISTLHKASWAHVTGPLGEPMPLSMTEGTHQQ